MTFSSYLGNRASRFPSCDNDAAFSNIHTDTSSSSNLDYGIIIINFILNNFPENTPKQFLHNYVFF